MAGKDVFLRRWFTWAILQWECDPPGRSDKFNILIIGTVSVWIQEFSRNIGTGLSLRDLLGDDKISLETSVRSYILSVTSVESKELPLSSSLSHTHSL